MFLSLLKNAELAVLTVTYVHAYCTNKTGHWTH